MKTESAYKSLPAKDKRFLSGIAKDVAMLVDEPEKRDFFQKQLTEFSDKWRAYKTAYEAGRKGKWQPSMGKPGNPLGTIWPYVYRDGWNFPEYNPRKLPIYSGPRDVRSILGAYAILSVIHDKVLVRCPSIAKDISPKELSQKIWRNLVTGRLEEDSISARRRVIPMLIIKNFLQDVRVDIESHFAPKKSTTQKPPTSGNAGGEKPAGTGQGNDPETIEIDLSLFSKGESRVLLRDLILKPMGVQGDSQKAKNLRAVLCDNKGDEYKKVAEHIHKKRNEDTICIDTKKITLKVKE